MRRHPYVLLLISLAAVIAAGYFLTPPEEPPQDQPRQVRKAVLEGEDTSVEQHWLEQRLWAPDNRRKAFERDAYTKAKRQFGQIQSYVKGRGLDGAGEALDATGVSGVDGTVWAPIGPSPIVQGTALANGRVSSIAVHPNNPNVIYMGASGGGVWRTIDGGASWTPLLDQEASIGLGEPSAIAIDPNDPYTIYVGTSTRYVMNTTRGILKTTDGGSSWVQLGNGVPTGNDGNADDLFVGATINVIIVEPTDSDILYLGATNGLYTSNDGGLNWTQATSGGGGDARALRLDTTSSAASRILYAGVSNTGIRQSTDGGQTYTTILSSATPAVNAALAGGTFRHVTIDLAPPTSPADPSGIQVMYVTMEGRNGAPDPVGIFLSTDQGGTWAQAAGGNLDTLWGVGTQGGFDMTLGVEPSSPGDGVNDTLYLGLISQFKSTDAGATFNATANGQHVDTHSRWVFVPRPAPNPAAIFTGNDGGIWRSDDSGATWTGTGTGGDPPSINAGGIQTALVYNLDVSNDPAATVTIGSTQDNGTVRGAGSPVWPDTQGGDGWDIAFDQVNVANAYISSGFWSPAPCTRIWKSTDGGATWPTEVTPWGTTSDQGCYLAPMNADPTLGDVIYASGNQNVWQTTDGGSNWRAILATTRAAQVKVAPANSNIVVAGFDDDVFVSTNALAATVGPPSGVTFANITRNLPNRGVTRVAIDPIDPTVIYATLSGFNSQTPAQPGHVFRTSIGGTTWTDISPPVDSPVNAIVIDSQALLPTIYIGNDIGVLRSIDQGTTWQSLDDIHFPNVPVTDLVINAQARTLRASTFGRGVFELTETSGPAIAINAENGLDFGEVCDGGPATLTLTVYNVGKDDLVVTSVRPLFDPGDFDVLPNPATPLVISPDAHVDFTVEFAPTTEGPQNTEIRIASNDPQAPHFDVLATGNSGLTSLATVIADSGSFGDVCRDTFKDLDLTLNNGGSCDLAISSIASDSPLFEEASTMSFPLVIGPGDSLAVPIRFAPDGATSFGAKNATITIGSNDPDSPADVSVSGNVPPGDIVVTGSTDFGDICAGELVEKDVSVCNTGLCTLNVAEAEIDCADFTIINNPFPAPVSHDFCVPLTIRFTPTSAGPKTCTLTITSDDPDDDPVTLTLTGNTPFPMIDVPPDQTFPPEVLQDVDACTTGLPFPVSNIGICPLEITDFEISSNPAEYSLSGLPSFPILLDPGHIAGDGDLDTVFGPLALDRDALGVVSVTYISEPILGTETTVDRDMCGEGTRTGARVLVRHGGVPLAEVKSIKLHRINANRNNDRLDTVDQAMKLTLQTVTPATPCAPFMFHREYSTVDNPIQLLPGSYQVTVQVRIDGRNKKKSVGFDVSSCDFNPTVVVDF